MKTSRAKLIFFFSAVLLSAATPLRSEDGYKIVSCVLHLHSSTFSGEKGSKSLEEIVQEARSKGIEVVIPTDKDMMSWSYGIWPLRDVLRVRYVFTSVLSKGPQKYLDEINRLEKKYPEVTVVPGVESAPFYYWKGSPFTGNLEMRGWHKHMMVLGMDNAGDYINLPVVSNRNAGSFDILLLWPVLLLAAVFVIRMKQALKITLIIAALVFLINNYPFKYFEFNAYSGDQGEKPYQKLIDYANSKGGLTFWAHPEAVNSETPRKIVGITVSTNRYEKSILDTKGYTGFAIFAEGWRRTGGIGGYWDQALMQYCNGSRERPVWAVGELDYGENSVRMEQEQNMLWLKDRSRSSVINALRNGNFYVSQQDKWGLRLNEFYLSSGGGTAMSGQEITRGGPAYIHMSLSATDHCAHPVKVSVIRNGAVDKVYEAVTPVEMIYKDAAAPAGKVYYRIYAESGFQAIAGNPVFLK